MVDKKNLTEEELEERAAIQKKIAQEAVADGKAVVDLPRELGQIFSEGTWDLWRRGSGKKFGSFAEAVMARQPAGLGLSQYNGHLTAAQAWALCTGHRKLQAELLKLAVHDVEPLAEVGRPEGTKNGSSTTIVQRGNEYLLARMKREANNGNKKAAKALERLASGELTSVVKAAVACGVKKPADSDATRPPIGRIKQYWKKATVKERKEFLAWLKTAEGKQA